MIGVLLRRPLLISTLLITLALLISLALLVTLLIALLIGRLLALLITLAVGMLSVPLLAISLLAISLLTIRLLIAGLVHTLIALLIARTQRRARLPVRFQCHLPQLPISADLYRDLIGLRLLGGLNQILRMAHVLAIPRHNDVIGANAGIIRGRLRQHFPHNWKLVAIVEHQTIRFQRVILA